MLASRLKYCWSRFADGARHALELPFAFKLMRRDFLNRLRMSEFQARDTVENAAEGIIRTSRNGQFVYVNPAFAHMLGYNSPNEVLTEITDVTSQVYVVSAVRLDFLERSNRDNQARCEYEAWKKDGSTMWLNVSARVVKDEKGAFLYYESIAEDVSERRKKEVQLSTLTQSLGRSNDELQRFAHIVAHDLKEPLRTITTYGQLLLRTQSEHLGPEGRQNIEFMREASGRMETLIDDILAFSQAQFNPSRWDLVDMNEVVASVLADLQTACREAGACIKVTTLPVVHANKAKMERLLQNLLNNALKFRKKDPLEVTVTASSRGADWIFEVSDNGIGFDDKYATRIFEFFVRLVDRRQYSGSGMGLAMCKRIVEFHGGSIWAKSQPGIGTSFFFSLPQETSAGDVPRLVGQQGL